MNSIHLNRQPSKPFRLFADFLSLFYPNYCLACSGSLLKGEDIICTRCLLELPQTNYHMRDDNPIKVKLSGRLSVKHAWAFLTFKKTGIVQHLLHQLKYNNHPEIGERLGKLYGKELKNAHYENEFDMIVPVPLHESRQRKRGYNQSALFAKGLSDMLNIPWSENISVRKTSTDTQTKKSKLERWENVKNVFDTRDMSIVKDKRVLLVDDVITTGATIEACGQCLLDGGCASLSIACIAEA